MGLLAPFTTISSTVTPDTTDDDSDWAHVLILTPFSVPSKVQFFKVTSATFPSPSYFPRLPMLIPCPGPHHTPVTFTPVHPSPIDTQSSPVPIIESVIRVLLERAMWTPSVLGLSPGAHMCTCSTCTLSDA
ncbi:mitochondrial transcription factor 1 [Striga asiatica]|uniref:Mitochondrial transcription factor 1 n=1 Tax=Striga asiatica TaxID=4170 RepID=A0A5A7QSC8_STRAF|nr:mitochondrial transcription factor 1 [Striga asiatica]